MHYLQTWVKSHTKVINETVISFETVELYGTRDCPPTRVFVRAFMSFLSYGTAITVLLWKQKQNKKQKQDQTTTWTFKGTNDLTNEMAKAKKQIKTRR